MTPTLFEGDIVAWTPIKMEEIQEGDVIVFKSYLHWPEEKIVVHRVNDIKTNSKGEILLETKGDKNEWVDQAGPHIPEPYIRKDHVMGKVISVGQFPLKIPFIGYLGIWINQGLDSISQPAAQKESISYAGIFAPLTISAIVLVIFIFILPEKAKTVKEKIHQYIHGRKPLNLRNTILSFLIAYVIFLTVIHAFAFDEVTASVGINDSSEDSNLNFGRIKPGTDSFPKPLPVINPSTMGVKGLIFGRGEIEPYIEEELFALQRGESAVPLLRANAPNGTANGTFTGKIMVYSSPFWFLFPDDFMINLAHWNPDMAVFILDLLSAIILTTITILMLTSISFVSEKLGIWLVDRSWRHPSKLILNKRFIRKIKRFKSKTVSLFRRGVIWMTKVDLAQIKTKEKHYSAIVKPLIASAVLFPILLLIEDKMLGTVFAVIFAGAIAYYISCKLRVKIIITTIITMSLSFGTMMINSNLIIIEKEQSMLELITLILGAMGVYLLVFSLLLIPLSIVAWLITRAIRNVKERKDPLLSIEGHCDL
jgi:signal peptidase I